MTRILIVEDDRATTGLLKTIFEMEGMKTSVCPDPGRVLDVIRQERPHLIFMDYHLAETESLPILRQLKQEQELRDIPVIMTSGLDRSQESIAAGAYSFIIKPFRPAELLAEIRTALGKQAS